ncbi:MAG: Rieske 2Fe-2S domain-containing protein [Burkholderiales bacterium]
MFSCQLSDLIRPDRIHRDVYVSDAVYEQERERLWKRAWVYAGHVSQIPNAGDYITVDIAGDPLVLVRRHDGTVHGLRNRCAHKGARLVSAPSGNVGKVFRCPYHAWTYRTDGSLLAPPRREGYAGTDFPTCDAAKGIAPVPGLACHRGFVFVRLSQDGPSFDAYAGTEVLRALDHLADRSPSGELEVAGGCLRTVIRANWKLYLENINDAMHPVTAHASASEAAFAVWNAHPEGSPPPMAMQQLLPFGSGYDFYDGIGARVLPNGHSILGTRSSLHVSYADLPEYEPAMITAHGAERTREILSFTPQNVILYPGLSFKASPQALRVIRPLGADRTVIEAWSFRPKRAPAALLQRAALYNRLVFSPMSVVAHDDIHLFESIQQAVKTDGNPWISLHRNFVASDRDDETRDVGGMDEALMRNQYRAWRQWVGSDG